MDQGASTDQPSQTLPGRRFIERFERRAHVHRLHPSRLWRLLLGLGILAFGIFNVFVPGPGGSILILTSLLVLSGESKLLALFLDWGEVRFARQVRWVLTHKVLAACLISGTAFVCVATLGYLLSR